MSSVEIFDKNTEKYNQWYDEHLVWFQSELDALQPIPLNPAIERSTANRQLNTFGMFRDVGVQLSGSQSVFNYAVALVNGTGANQTEQIDPKDVIGRVSVNLTDELAVGVSGHVGQYQIGPSGDDHENS